MMMEVVPGIVKTNWKAPERVQTRWTKAMAIHQLGAAEMCLVNSKSYLIDYGICSQSAACGPMAARRNIPGGPQ